MESRLRIRKNKEFTYSDDEIAEMLNNPEPVYMPLNKKNSEKVKEFINSHSSIKPVPMGHMINIPLTVKGVSLNLKSGFSIYSDVGEIYGTSLDNCTIRLEDKLSHLKNKEIFHEKDGSGFYLYIFLKSVNMEIVFNGKFFKWYDFKFWEGGKT